MANELTTLDKNNLTPSQIGDYIHTVKEVERDLLTLEEMDKQLNGRIASLRMSINNLKPNFIETINSPNEESEKEAILSRYEKKAAEAKSKTQPFGVYLIKDILLSGLALFFPYHSVPFAVLFLVIAGISIPFSVLIFHPTIYFGIASIFLIRFIPLLKKDIRKIKETEAEIEKLTIEKHKELDGLSEKIKEINRYNKNVPINNQKEQERYENTKAIKENELSLIQNEANLVHTKYNELLAIHNNLYSIGIIPPDYRTMDCVYVFDQIFRNDLADNMRQAVALYEERVFRGEIIKGMGTIISKLDSLQGTMSDLVSDIYSVKQNVSFMSQDVYRMAEAQSKHNDKMLENSKATRYAAETVQKYSEEAKKYFGF